MPQPWGVGTLLAAQAQVPVGGALGMLSLMELAQTLDGPSGWGMQCSLTASGSRQNARVLPAGTPL